MATASPMPRLAPVTSATCPSNRRWDVAGCHPRNLSGGADGGDDAVGTARADHPVRRRIVLVVDPDLDARSDPRPDGHVGRRIAFAPDDATQRRAVERDGSGGVRSGRWASRMRSSPPETSSRLRPIHHTSATDSGSSVHHGIQSVSGSPEMWNSAASREATPAETRYHHHGVRSVSSIGGSRAGRCVTDGGAVAAGVHIVEGSLGDHDHRAAACRATGAGAAARQRAAAARLRVARRRRRGHRHRRRRHPRAG